MDWTPIIVALVALASSLGGNLLLLRKVNAEARKIGAEAKLASENADAIHKKSGADAADVITDAAGDMVKMLCDEIARKDLQIGQRTAEACEERKRAERMLTTHEDDQQQIKDLQFLNAQLRQQLMALRERDVQE